MAGRSNACTGCGGCAARTGSPPSCREEWSKTVEHAGGRPLLVYLPVHAAGGEVPSRTRPDRARPGGHAVRRRQRHRQVHPGRSSRGDGRVQPGGRQPQLPVHHPASFGLACQSVSLSSPSAPSPAGGVPPVSWWRRARTSAASSRIAAASARASEPPERTLRTDSPAAARAVRTYPGVHSGGGSLLLVGPVSDDGPVGRGRTSGSTPRAGVVDRVGEPAGGS